MEQTDSCQRREGTGWKKVKELAKKLIYVTHTKQYVIARGKGWGRG